jgi:hypothetical protein
MCDPAALTVNGQHPEDMRAMETKSITIPLDIAERIESRDETADDLEWLRRELANTWPDWIF